MNLSPLGLFVQLFFLILKVVHLCDLFKYCRKTVKSRAQRNRVSSLVELNIHVYRTLELSPKFHLDSGVHPLSCFH
jgi:hypothetical protein